MIFRCCLPYCEIRLTFLAYNGNHSELCSCSTTAWKMRHFHLGEFNFLQKTDEREKTSSGDGWIPKFNKTDLLSMCCTAEFSLRDATRPWTKIDGTLSKLSASLGKF